MTFKQSRSRLLTLLFAMLLVPALLVACADDGGDDVDVADTDDPVATTEVNGDTATETPTETTEGADTPTPTGAADNGDGEGEEVSIEMVDIDYSTDQIEATAGEPLTVNSENTGALEHTFTIDEGPFSNVSSEGGTGEGDEEYAVNLFLEPGGEGSVTFTTTEPGEYTFYCTIPGHREAGMEGTLIVE